MPRVRRPKPLVKGRTEKQVTAEVLDLAGVFGVQLERRNVGLACGASGRPVSFGKAGDPDYELTRMPESWANFGRRVAIELKREGYKPPKRPTPPDPPSEERQHFEAQITRMKEINAAGGLAFWIDSARALQRFLARLKTQPDLRIEFEHEWAVMVFDEDEAI